MADLTITASQVVFVSGEIEMVQPGEAVTVGQVCYKAANGTWLKAQCDGTAVEAGSEGIGVALGSTSSTTTGQRIGMAKPGSIVTLGAGAAPVAGVVYYVSNTAGGFSPVADLGSTDKVTAIGVGIGSNQILLFKGTYNAGAVLA